MPFTASVLVRNIELTESSTNVVGRNIPIDSLSFGDFTIRRVQSDETSRLQKRFELHNISVEDFLFEKTYATAPPTPHWSPSGVGGIPEDIEDTLFLLRLFTAGEISFVRLVIEKPDGHVARQEQYRIINGVNTYRETAELGEDDATKWLSFAKSVQSTPAWSSQWFAISKRFFLYGCVKEFNPPIGEVDRIVDYLTALESALVPEKSFVGRRLRERASRLLSSDTSQQAVDMRIVRDLYDMRSSIVHGSLLSGDQTSWLNKNRKAIEALVKRLMVKCAQNVPASEPGRSMFLKSLFDITDSDRAASVMQNFAEIKDKKIRLDCAGKVIKKA